MITQIYAVYDKKAEAYQMPFFSVNDATAIRMLSRAVLDSNSMLGANPEDFQLMHIAAFDDSVGVITPCMIRVVTEINSLVSKQVQDDLH